MSRDYALVERNLLITVRAQSIANRLRPLRGAVC